MPCDEVSGWLGSLQALSGRARLAFSAAPPPTPTLPRKGGGRKRAPPGGGFHLGGRSVLSPSPLAGEGRGGGSDVRENLVQLLCRRSGPTEGATRRRRRHA